MPPDVMSPQAATICHQMLPYSPGDLLVAPLRPIGTSVLQRLKHQQVALSVAKQQVSISPTGSIQKTFNSLKKKKREKPNLSADKQKLSLDFASLDI